VIAHVVTRKLGAAKKAKPKPGDKKAAAIQAALADVAGLCLDSRVSDKPTLQKFVAYCRNDSSAAPAGSEATLPEAASAASRRTKVPIAEDDDDVDDDNGETDERASTNRATRVSKPMADPERMAKALESFVRDLKTAKQEDLKPTKKDN
jgi:hypothetical protein